MGICDVVSVEGREGRGGAGCGEESRGGWLRSSEGGGYEENGGERVGGCVKLGIGEKSRL